MKLADDEILVLALKSPDLSESTISSFRAALRRELGEGRVMLIGLSEETQLDMATIKAPPQQLNVKVSGAEVYRAVKNYIKSNEILHGKIKETVEGLVNTGYIKQKVEELVKLHYGGYTGRSTMDATLKEVVTAEVKNKINTEIQAQVENVMQRAVFVMPPKENKT